jgi:hypothetical protein
MSAKRKADYVAVLQAIVNLLPRRPRVKRFLADFEAGLWRALQVVLPRVKRKGCSFHLRQAIWRKVCTLIAST